jgi:hypothetical protein
VLFRYKKLEEPIILECVSPLPMNLIRALLKELVFGSPIYVSRLLPLKRILKSKKHKTKNKKTHSKLPFVL